MTIRKTLLLLLAAVIGHAGYAGSVSAAEIAPHESIVSVRMNADFHPELEFRIAEALRRPPVDWSVVPDHTFAEISQPVENQELADDIIAKWEALFANNPTHIATTTQSLASQMEYFDEARQQIEAISSDFVAAWLGTALPNSGNVHAEDVISLDDLPQIHTGEDIALQLEAEFAQFPLDPYGYEEYNCYFEPEVYDWFVFVTDDLTVVYVHENSDVVPVRLDPTMLAKDVTEPAVPEVVKDWIRESVRSVAAGEIEVMQLASQANRAWQAASSPIWNRYVKENHLLRVERVAQLREFFRF
ncbi:hypothetical protein DTL21_26230 [Bremerella cremea]|uniref:Uncharacterized protein n=1 Tax=Blastopirellula marina TaxID=124 RepID=A0A2S8FBL4_9BACT|nr:MULTISPECIES: hypothetical protein [Pirellulaceae]PQO29551.1 hypothetical protein C5Y83_26185 [Blastopirellula marina]RCS42855.1 hypothetical protein DTL21_26230 [Bremerella cremea]